MPAAAQPGAVAAPEAFSEAIDGSTVEFVMLPLPGEGETLWMSRTEITWDLYDIYLYRLDQADPDAADADGLARPSKPYVPPDRGWGHAGFPAIGMTRHAAEQFCVWLSARTGRTYRLPTHEEWLRACDTDDERPIEKRAWFAGNADRRTHAVGTRLANAHGFVDLIGNAAEWVDTGAGKNTIVGGSYRDGQPSCASSETQQFGWNASDPQFPKSQWWLADAPFVGFRVVCEDAPRPEAEDSEPSPTTTEVRP